MVERPFSLPYVEAATDLIALNNVSVTPVSDEPYLTEASGPVAKTRGTAAFPNFLTLHALSWNGARNQHRGFSSSVALECP